MTPDAAVFYLCLGVGLAGCAAPYWRLDAEPLPVERVERLADVTRICGPRNWGCYSRIERVAYVQTGLPPSLETCILSHERKHADGWSHDLRGGYAVDCGDGTFWLPRLSGAQF